MGDRVVIVTKAGSDIAPAIYGHWIGSEAPDLIVQAGLAGLIRKGDPSYAAARILGFLHEQDARSETGLGLLAAPDDLEPATLRAFSHGDAGVIVVDVGTGQLSYVGGYAENRPASVELVA